MGGFADGILSPQICLAADVILAGRPVDDVDEEAEARAFLAALDYRTEADKGSADVLALANRRALLQLAARLRRLFLISPPDAPHLIFIGGEADTGLIPGNAPGAAISLAGAGLSLKDAFERCVGEGAESLSQIETEADIVCRARPSEISHGLPGDAASAFLAMLAGDVEATDAEIDWVEGRCLASAEHVRLPADLCLRRSEPDRGVRSLVNVGTGCAAGPTEEAAIMAAALELIERDAAALWWEGGRPPRPISLEVGEAAGAGTLLRQTRGAAKTRQSWLLDITTDLGVPCVASVSLANDGHGFACGLAAGLSIGSAIRSAIVEMCQMELSHQIIALKRRQRGDAALNRHDLAHVERARLVDANTPAIQPRDLPNDWRALPDSSGDPELTVQYLAERFEELAVNTYLVNLTREQLAVPVWKVIATGLQPYPSELETSRLAKTIEQYDGGNNSAPRIPLL